jgi:endonuclease/exonuclease/phosphatase family metal-dependent hydrolase
MKLCLITCNIRFDNPADGSKSWSYRRELLKETLLKHQPDVIATQEGRFAQLLDLAELLPEFELVDQHRSWIKERMYPSFFVRKGIFEIIKSDDLWLSETPHIAGSSSFDSAFPRLMTYLKIQPRNHHQTLMFVNTHLDHVKKETRANQIRVLSKEVKKCWHNGHPLIIMGDFNDAPDSEVRNHLMESFPGLQDAWKKFHSQEETSHHAFTGEMQNGSRIDWILIDQSIQVESALMDKSQKDGLYPTDHFPIICSISL